MRLIQVPQFSLLWLSSATLFLGLALALYFHNRKSPQNILFSIYLTLVFIFTLLGFFTLVLGFPAPIMVSLQMINNCFLGIVFVFFTRTFIEETRKPNPVELLWFVPALYFIIYGLIRTFIPGFVEQAKLDITVVDFKLVRKIDIHYYIYTAFLFYSHLMGFITLFKAHRAAVSPDEKWRIRTILIALLFGVVLVLIFNNLFTILGIPVQGDYTFFVILITLTVISISLMRHGAWRMEKLFDIIRDREKKLTERSNIIESELDMARLIQKNLIPLKPPEVPGFSIFCPLSSYG